MSLEPPKGENIQSLRRVRFARRMFGFVTFLLVLLIITGSLLLFFKNKIGAEERSPGGTATAFPTPTFTPTLFIPTEAIFYDTFLDNSHKWELSNHGGYIRTLANGMLILADMNPSTTLVESLPNDNVYADFSASIDFTIAKGDANDSVGLYLRGDNNLDHDYRVDINGNNTFDIAKEYLDINDDPQSTMLYGPHSSPALHPRGHQNTLTVIMNGTSIVVSLNQDVVASITDSEYTSGQIALFAHHGTTSDDVIVSISRVEIENVPLQSP